MMLEKTGVARLFEYVWAPGIMASIGVSVFLILQMSQIDAYFDYVAAKMHPTRLFLGYGLPPNNESACVQLLPCWMPYPLLFSLGYLSYQ